MATKTYKLTADGHISNDYIDNQEAYIQSVWKTIHTERYMHAIYSGNYGFETRDLFNESPSFVKSVIKSRVQECLEIDDRFIRIVNFEIVPFADISTFFQVQEKLYLDGTWSLNGLYLLDGKGSTKKTYLNDRSTVAFRCNILSIYGNAELFSYQTFV